MPTAQATARRAELKAAISPSPSDLMATPRCSATCSRMSWSRAASIAAAASSPRFTWSSVEASTSVNRTVTVPSRGASVMALQDFAFEPGLSPEAPAPSSKRRETCGRTPVSGYAKGSMSSASDHQNIVIRGAREHNLKNFDLTLPRDRLIVITGLSGSGKSSLAFDTIYAEGQRRYVESLSAYARQFLGQMEKPDVDHIEGLSPAISIDQKGTSRNPRSTVGTVTEIYDYLRLLYARIGHPHCPKCGREIHKQTVEQMADQVERMPAGTRLLILGPVVKGRKGEYERLLEDIRRQGFSRVRVDGRMYEMGEKIPLERYKQHDIEVVVDRLVVGPEQRTRLVDSLEIASKLGQGSVLIVPAGGGDEIA